MKNEDPGTHQDVDRACVEQVEVFEHLYGRVENLLEEFGRPDFLPGQRYGDYSVHGDYSEYPQIVVFVNNLELLRTRVVSALQQLLGEFQNWQIDMMVAVRGHYKDWPNMGVSIRQNEIIDALQRQYLPKEFRDLRYENARTGSVAEFVSR